MFKIQEMEQINTELLSQNREAVLEVQRLDRDLRQLLQVNEAFQIQTSEMSRKEQQYQEAAREYRERSEMLKIE